VILSFVMKQMRRHNMWTEITQLLSDQPLTGTITGINTTIKIKTSTKTVITTRSAQTARMTSIRRLRRITGSGVRISGNSSVSM